MSELTDKELKISSRGPSKAECEPQRRHMLQEWADMVDARVNGQKRAPMLLPASMAFMDRLLQSIGHADH